MAEPGVIAAILPRQPETGESAEVVVEPASFPPWAAEAAEITGEEGEGAEGNLLAADQPGLPEELQEISEEEGEEAERETTREPPRTSMVPMRVRGEFSAEAGVAAAVEVV